MQWVNDYFLNKEEGAKDIDKPLTNPLTSNHSERNHPSPAIRRSLKRQEKAVAL
jgi:hypothetical protein